MYPIAACTRCGSRVTATSSTRSSPSSSASAPQINRINVVFPAPSGPTSAKTSPRATVSERRSPATVAPKRRVTPAISIASRGSDMDDRVHREAGLERCGRIVELNSDAEHKILDALLFGLHASRRKLRGVADLSHRSNVCPARHPVDRHVGVHPRLDVREAGLADVDIDVRVDEVPDGHRGRTGLQEIPDLEVVRDDVAIERSGQVRLADLVLGETERGAGLRQRSFCRRKLRAALRYQLPLRLGGG